MDVREKLNQNLEELLEALSKIRESHPEVFNFYMNRLIKKHVDLIAEIKSN